MLRVQPIAQVICKSATWNIVTVLLVSLFKGRQVLLLEDLAPLSGVSRVSFGKALKRKHAHIVMPGGQALPMDGLYRDRS